MGAPPEVVERLTVVRQEFESRQRSSVTSRDASKDPELDQFMVNPQPLSIILPYRIEAFSSKFLKVWSLDFDV